MNKDRRKEIDACISDVQGTGGQIKDLTTRIQAVLDEEQEALDAMPESLQQGDRGQASGLAIDQLQEALDTLAEIEMDDVVPFLEEAKT